MVEGRIRTVPINWQVGLFRVWVLASVMWAIGWGLLLLPSASQKIVIARMTDRELILTECRSPPDVPPPPQTLYLDDCAKRLGQEGREVRWGGGDGSFEQAFRIARALAPELTFLILPPIGLLLFGAALGWVLGGFTSA